MANKRAVIIATDGRIIEFASQARALKIACAVNVEQVVRTRRGEIARVELTAFGDDNRMKARAGDPQRLSHKYETDTNPRGVWELQNLRPFTDM